MVEGDRFCYFIQNVIYLLVYLFVFTTTLQLPSHSIEKRLFIQAYVGVIFPPDSLQTNIWAQTLCKQFKENFVF